MYSRRELDVVAALVKKEGRALLCQRKEDDAFGLLWEFPGGKIEIQESKEQALKRELKEELDIDIEIGPFIAVFEDETPDLKIRDWLFEAIHFHGEITCLECEAFGFFSLDQISRLKLAPVDIKIAEFIRSKKIL